MVTADIRPFNCMQGIVTVTCSQVLVALTHIFLQQSAFKVLLQLLVALAHIFFTAKMFCHGLIYKVQWVYKCAHTHTHTYACYNIEKWLIIKVVKCMAYGFTVVQVAHTSSFGTSFVECSLDFSCHIFWLKRHLAGGAKNDTISSCHKQMEHARYSLHT